MSAHKTPDDVFDLAASIAREIVYPNEPDVPADVCETCHGIGSLWGDSGSGHPCIDCNGSGAR